MRRKEQEEHTLTAEKKCKPNSAVVEGMLVQERKRAKKVKKRGAMEPQPNRGGCPLETIKSCSGGVLPECCWCVGGHFLTTCFKVFNTFGEGQ